MKVEVNDATIASIHSLGIGASKDDVTPVITSIVLQREGDNLRAITTDRYMCLTGLYENVSFDGWSEGEEILIDPKHLKSVVDVKKKDKKLYNLTTVSIVQSPNGYVHAQLGEDSGGLFIGGGNPQTTRAFPPVMKLFPKGEPNGSGSLNIRPDFIAKLAKVLPPVSRPERDRIWSFEFRSIEEQPNKPQPVYAHYDGQGYKLEALIQPALIQR